MANPTTNNRTINIGTTKYSIPNRSDTSKLTNRKDSIQNYIVRIDNTLKSSHATIDAIIKAFKPFN